MIGKLVWSSFGNSALRMGKVVDEKVEDDWRFVKVDWVNDGEFQQDRERVIGLRGWDKYSDWYRIDSISVFEKQEVLDKLEQL